MLYFRGLCAALQLDDSFTSTKRQLTAKLNEFLDTISIPPEPFTPKRRNPVGSLHTVNQYDDGNDGFSDSIDGNDYGATSKINANCVPQNVGRDKRHKPEVQVECQEMIQLVEELRVAKERATTLELQAEAMKLATSAVKHRTDIQLKALKKKTKTPKVKTPDCPPVTCDDSPVVRCDDSPAVRWKLKVLKCSIQCFKSLLLNIWTFLQASDKEEETQERKDEGNGADSNSCD